MISSDATCIRRSRARQPLADLALVLAAADIDHHIEFDGHQWALWVESERVAEAEAQLDGYERELVTPPPPPWRAPVVDTGLVGVLGYLLIIWALPSLEGAITFGWPWREAGVMDALLVTRGEWWRTVTALTLHGDLAHLLSNSVFGAVFGWFVGRYLGSGFGWLLVLLAGAAGNAINAFWQDPGFRSVGASTATFAAVSLVGGYVWQRGYLRGWDWRRRFAPVFGAVALLAYTGFGGGDVDVTAHVAGFGCGLVFGLLVGSDFVPEVRRIGRAGQVVCGLAAVGLVVLAWAAAGAHTA